VKKRMSSWPASWTCANAVRPAASQSRSSNASLGRPGPFRDQRVEALRDEAQRRPQDAQELRRAGRDVDRAVELPVRLAHPRGVAGALGRGELALELVQPRHERVVRLSAGSLRQLGGERRVHPEDVADVLARGRHHAERAAGRDVDEPLGGEAQQRLAHWHGADAEQPRKLVLRHLRVGCQLAREDHVAQRLGDLHGQRPAAERPGRGPGPLVVLHARHALTAPGALRRPPAGGTPPIRP
jgi:hypothetical protein